MFKLIFASITSITISHVVAQVMKRTQEKSRSTTCLTVSQAMIIKEVAPYIKYVPDVHKL